jgi:hypothetical protein
MRDGRVQGCGVRLVGGEARAPVSSWFDVSVNVFGADTAIAQSIVYEMKISGPEGDSVPTIAPVETTWIHIGEATTRRGENAERKSSLVYTVSVEDAIALFETVARGDSVTLGIKRWGQAEEVLYTGIPFMVDETREHMSACLEAMASEGE